MATSPPEALNALRKAGVEFQVHEHAAAHNADELHLTGLDVSVGVKTLAFSLPDRRVALAAIPGLARLRYPKLASALGLARSALRPAVPEVLAGLGMLPGGVAPFTSSPLAVLVCDAAVFSQRRVYCGAGSPELSVEINPEVLRVVMPQLIIADLIDA